MSDPQPLTVPPDPEPTLAEELKQIENAIAELDQSMLSATARRSRLTLLRSAVQNEITRLGREKGHQYELPLEIDVAEN